MQRNNWLASPFSDVNRDLIFVPVLAQIALTLAVYVVLIKAKVRAIRAGECDQARRPLYDDAFPEYVLKINNNLRNQFELPVLFYVLAFALWALDAVGILALSVASLFVASRILHAWIHCTSNIVAQRRRVFTVGWWLVVAMLALAAWEFM